MKACCVILLSSALSIVGCGSASSVSTPENAGPLSIGGNWEVAGAPAAGATSLPTPIAAFFGSLSNKGNTVSGTMHAVPAPTNPCIAISQDLIATGDISNSGLLALAIPIAGGTAHISAQLNTTLQTVVAANYSIDGGTCAMSTTAGNISQFALVTGTYTGSLTEGLPAGASVVSVTATLEQSSVPNSDGLFPLSGAVSVSGPCSATFSFTDGTVSGNNINQFYQLAYPPPSGLLRGGTNPTGTSLQANLALYTPSCVNTYFGGTLSKQ